MSKESATIMILTIWIVSTIMMLFFGWLSTKMELYSGAVNFWCWLNLICGSLFFIINRKPKQR
jgi:hypothetical protein